MRTSLLFLSLLFLLVSSGLIAQPPSYTTHVHPGAPGGYYFVSPFTQNMSDGYQMVIDSVGELQYYKHMNAFSLDFKQLPGGRVSYWKAPFYFILNAQLQKVDSITTLNGIYPDEHDIQITPNGNYLLMGYEYRTMDLSLDSIFMSFHVPGSKMASVKAVVIQEITPNKQLAFEWKAADHLPFNTVDDFFVFDSLNVDWTHSNAVEYDLDGNLLLSSRHLNEITKINRQTGQVIWHFGGKYNNFTFIGDTVPFYGQHDVRRLPNGHLTLFDNGRNKSNLLHGARALEYQLDETNLTAKRVKSYGYYPNQFSIAMGNVHCPDSNFRVINYGIYKDIFFNVVDNSNSSVFEMDILPGYYNYRAFHYQHLPKAMQSIPLNCTDSAGILKIAVAGQLDGIYWNTGDNSSSLTVTTTGVYYAMVKTADGGFVRTQNFRVDDLNYACLNTNLTTVTGNQFQLYPNPFSSTVLIKGVNNASSIVWMNTTGQVVFPTSTEFSDGRYYDFQHLEKGLYIVRVDSKVFKVMHE